MNSARNIPEAEIEDFCKERRISRRAFDAWREHVLKADRKAEFALPFREFMHYYDTRLKPDRCADYKEEPFEWLLIYPNGCLKRIMQFALYADTRAYRVPHPNITVDYPKLKREMSTDRLDVALGALVTLYPKDDFEYFFIPRPTSKNAIAFLIGRKHFAMIEPEKYD